MENPIGMFVRQRRLALGLSQEQLAELVGGSYAQSDISRIERGHIDLPRIGTLIKLAAGLEVPVGNLLIASGWFDERHFAPMSSSRRAIEQNMLETVLTSIEVEIDAILELERQAQSRSDRLRTALRELKTMRGVAVTMSGPQPYI